MPSLGLAADGELCTTGVSGTTCYTICDKAAAGAFTCEFSVGTKGTNLDRAIIRAYKGTSAAGCGYDDVAVYETTDTNAGTAGYELPLLGTLDDDGSGSGVKQITLFGPIGPVIYVAGTATAGTCDASNELHIQLILYHTKRN